MVHTCTESEFRILTLLINVPAFDRRMRNKILGRDCDIPSSLHKKIRRPCVNDNFLMVENFYIFDC